MRSLIGCCAGARLFARPADRLDGLFLCAVGLPAELNTVVLALEQKNKISVTQPQPVRGGQALFQEVFSLTVKVHAGLAKECSVKLQSVTTAFRNSEHRKTVSLVVGCICVL